MTPGVLNEYPTLCGIQAKNNRYPFGLRRTLALATCPYCQAVEQARYGEPAVKPDDSV